MRFVSCLVLNDILIGWPITVSYQMFVSVLTVTVDVLVTAEQFTIFKYFGVPTPPVIIGELYTGQNQLLLNILKHYTTTAL